MSDTDKPLVWLGDSKDGIQTPPMSVEARRETGLLLRQLQQGEKLKMPESKPMPEIGKQVHELRIDDDEMKVIWRVIYKIADDAILVVDVFKKKTKKTPQTVIDRCKLRIKRFEKAVNEEATKH